SPSSGEGPNLRRAPRMRSPLSAKRARPQRPPRARGCRARERATRVSLVTSRRVSPDFLEASLAAAALVIGGIAERVHLAVVLVILLRGIELLQRNDFG